MQHLLSKDAYRNDRRKDLLPSPDEKKAQIAKIVEQIGKNTAQDIEIIFVDESHFSNQPYVSRGWFKRGEKKQ